MSCLIFFAPKEMAFKFVLFAAVCLAQGLAFDPMRAMQRNAVCKNPGTTFVSEIHQAAEEMDSVRDEVSMAAMEAYANGRNVRVAVACFIQQGPDYIKSGAELGNKVLDATTEVLEILEEKAERYAKRMEEPVKALVVTFATVPVQVNELIQKKQFLKAAILVLEARKVISENSLLVAEALVDMAGEVPEVADKVEEFAKDIYATARNNAQELRQAYRTCIEQGGPQKPLGSEESVSEE